jgi:hypothetical protein
MANVTINTDALDAMRYGRVSKALEKLYNFSEVGIMSLGEYLASRDDWTRKSRNVRNHSLKRVHLSHVKTRKITTRTVWHGRLGIDIPKVIYDLIDLPETVHDECFDSPGDHELGHRAMTTPNPFR